MAGAFDVPFQTMQGLSGLRNQRQQFDAREQQMGIQQQQADMAAQQQAQQAQEQEQFNELFSQAVGEDGSIDASKLAAISRTRPEVAKYLEKRIGVQNEEHKTALLGRASGMARALKNLGPDEALAYFKEQGLDQDPILGILGDNLAAGDLEGARKELEVGISGISPDAYDEIYGVGGDSPAGVREFNSMISAAGLEGDPERRAEAALVSLGLKPRAGISASERIAQDPELAARVADLERQTTAAKETGKLETQKQILPEIRKSVQEAEQEAKSRGEALSEYDRAKAALPGLREVVGKLKTLSDVATYTMGGKVFDTVVKELGFGATEGATARSKMESLVNNQILPLLRDTFGSQFTEKEGESLKRTMLDIDAAPEQKKQVLDSFIEQKMRDLEMKRGRAGEADSAESVGGAVQPEVNLSASQARPERQPDGSYAGTVQRGGSSSEIDSLVNKYAD